MKKNLLVLLFSLSTAICFASEAPKKVYKVKWVLAHEPIDLFKIAADSFTKEVSEKTNGAVSFEVMSLPEYEKKYNKSQRIPYNKFVSKIQDNSIEMSQTYTTDLAALSKPMFVLDLPFLFRDHDHAAKVLEGQIGEQLLAGLSSSNIRGLAFTYSGGYRIIPGVKKIQKIEDFKGLNIRTSPSPIARETFEILGAKTLPMRLDSIEEGFKTGKIDEAESTYARYFPLGHNKHARIVNETEHSLLLTSIVINEEFWNKLPKEYQAIMKEAAVRAAKLERDYSVKVGHETRQKCIDDGVEVVNMNKNELGKFRAATRPIYEKFAPIIGKDLITSIQAQ